MEMKAQDSNVNVNSGRVGWGQQSSQSAQPRTLCYAGKDEMAALAEANPDFLGRSIGLWDPLGALDTNFWGLGNEQTIGYLRHAEIKHGRVAMAAFLGYIVQSTPLVSGPHNILPFRGYEPGLTPPEQWDAIPLYGKLQILVLVGMLESYGEILDPHYTQGGLPGYYPPIKGRRPELAFNLYNPFDWNMDRKDKVRGRQVEINNGRLAMLGIFSFLAESKAPGAVPPSRGSFLSTLVITWCHSKVTSASFRDTGTCLEGSSLAPETESSEYPCTTAEASTRQLYLFHGLW